MFEDVLFGALSFGLLFVLVIFKCCLDILDHLVPLLCWVMFGFLIGFAFLRGSFGITFFALYEDDGFEGFVRVFVVALSIEQLKLFLWDW